MNSTLRSLRPGGEDPLPTVGATTPEVLDQITEAGHGKAAQFGAVGQNLGQTAAFLGSSVETGFWMKTSLGKVETPRQIRDHAPGNSVAVRLIPVGGLATAGSRLSLVGMRVLNVLLSDLVPVEVYR
ncbi:MAG: hypothetical protein R8G34_05380 [Paracoccaceae bacterium]|nr:hypothetical protein [Paracoccaceae bacterium]